LPGGDKAVKEPWRMALSYLHRAYGNRVLQEHPGFFERFEKAKVETIISMIEKNVNSPLTSSAGRLFDAVASILRISDEITFEGEAAIELEMRSAQGENGHYPFDIVDGEVAQIDTRPLIKKVVKDLKGGTSVSVISSKFHNTVKEIIITVAKRIRDREGLERVALSGGVFQNFLLLNSAIEGLEKEGFSVWTNHRVPPNDGGISLGQAAVAMERVKKIK
jgi:hydrogenase maturation protein HypF